VAQAREVTDEMLLVAAQTLAAEVGPGRVEAGALYPPAAALREVSRAIAVAVVREARDEGVGRAFRDEDVEPAVDAARWYPAYPPYVPAVRP